MRPVDNTLRTQGEERETLAQAKLAARARQKAEKAEKENGGREVKIKPKDMFKTEELVD